jgi:hypothetical protein
MGNSVDGSVRTIPFRLSAGDRPVFSVYFQFLPKALGICKQARGDDKPPRAVLGNGMLWSIRYLTGGNETGSHKNRREVPAFPLHDQIQML